MQALLAGLCCGPLAAVTGLVQEGFWPGTARGHLNSTVVQGNLAYLATGGGLFVVDVSDPAQPKRIGELLIGDVGAVVTSDTLACLGTGAGFKTVNVANPAHPVVVGSLELTAWDWYETYPSSS